MPCFSGIDELKSANANCAASAVAAAKKKERTRMKLSEVITAVLAINFCYADVTASFPLAMALLATSVSVAPAGVIVMHLCLM
jgi:hypothetical protein